MALFVSNVIYCLSNISTFYGLTHKRPLYYLLYTMSSLPDAYSATR